MLCDCEIKDLLIKFWYSWIFANTAKLYQVKDIITQSTVNASNPKSQKILKNSLSNHLDKLIDTDITAIKFIIQINKYTFYITAVLTR